MRHRPQATYPFSFPKENGYAQKKGIFFSLAPNRFFSLEEKKWVGPPRDGASLPWPMSQMPIEKADKD